MYPEKELQLNVGICYPWEKTDRTPRYTGIPPHVVLLAEMAKVVSGQEKLPEEIKDLMVKELDERELEPGANVKKILEVVESQDQILGKHTCAAQQQQ